MGSLFGILGVALATPFTAAAMTLADALAPEPEFTQGPSSAANRQDS